MIRIVLLIAVVALAALVLTRCERLFPDVEDWIADSETLARRFDARLGDLKECVEEDNCEEALDTERGVFVMCSWVMSRGELALEGFAAAEWQRFDTLRSARGWRGCWSCRRRTRSCVLRTSRLRQTASVMESVLTSNPESGKRWNDTKVGNGQSLTSAHWKPRDSVVSRAAQPHL